MIKLPRYKGFIQYPFEPVKQNICQKNAKINPKISKLHLKPQNYYKIHMNFQKPSNHYRNQPKIKTKT